MPKKIILTPRGRKQRPSGFFVGGGMAPDLSFPLLTLTAAPFSFGESADATLPDFPTRLRVQIQKITCSTPVVDLLISCGDAAPKPLGQARVLGPGKSLAPWRVGGVSLHLDLGALSDFEIMGNATFHKAFPVSQEPLTTLAGGDCLTLYPYGGLLPQPLGDFDQVRPLFFYPSILEGETVVHLEDIASLASLGLTPPNPGTLGNCAVTFQGPAVSTLGADLRDGAVTVTLSRGDGENRTYGSTGFDMTGGQWVLLEIQ